VTIREVTPNPTNIRHVVENMRERDFKEIMALRWDDDLGALINDMIVIAGPMWRVWELDGEPVSIAGLTPIRPGVVLGGAFGTKKWRHAVRAMMTWGRDWAVPRLLAANVHRGEAYALASNTDSRKFIEAIGGEIETPLYHYGREREDFLLYVWRFDDVCRWRRRKWQSGASRDSGQPAAGTTGFGTSSRRTGHPSRSH
jgi:RimJ/RimL family protein N-acetyltransferase